MENSLKSMPTAELAEVVSLFPWFNAARVEYCKRKARTGEAGYGEAALYTGSRKVLYDLVNERVDADYRDKDVADFLREAPKRKVVVVGGDFFSQDEYDNVRQEGDNVFSNMTIGSQSARKEVGEDEICPDFCTETLAEIYADQGYYDQAKYIYSKLILRYPEKNAYFAALIGKLGENQGN